jgi:hypothetical protein
MAVSCESLEKYVNTVCKKYKKFSIKPDSTYTNHWALKSSVDQ